MGGVFAFFFAIFVGLIGFILLAIGIILLKRIKVVSIILFIVAGVLEVPMLCFIYIITTGIISYEQMKTDYKKEYGPLVAALKYNKPIKAYKLIHKGIDLEQVDEDGDTPLHIACAHQNIRIVKALISKKVNMNIKNKDGEIPLHIAIGCPIPDLEIITLLVNNESDINSQDNKGDTPLMIIVKKYSYIYEHSYVSRFNSIIDMLMNKGADVNLKNDNKKAAIDIINDYITDYTSKRTDYSSDGCYLEALEIKRKLSNHITTSSTPTTLLSHFVPFASLSYAQNAPSLRHGVAS
jgi:hypothetical protein